MKKRKNPHNDTAITRMYASEQSTDCLMILLCQFLTDRTGDFKYFKLQNNINFAKDIKNLSYVNKFMFNSIFSLLHKKSKLNTDITEIKTKSLYINLHLVKHICFNNFQYKTLRGNNLNSLKKLKAISDSVKEDDVKDLIDFRNIKEDMAECIMLYNKFDFEVIRKEHFQNQRRYGRMYYMKNRNASKPF